MAPKIWSASGENPCYMYISEYLYLYTNNTNTNTKQIIPKCRGNSADPAASAMQHVH